MARTSRPAASSTRELPFGFLRTGNLVVLALRHAPLAWLGVAMRLLCAHGARAKMRLRPWTAKGAAPLTANAGHHQRLRCHFLNPASATLRDGAAPTWLMIILRRGS
jgi:hypothetical protein